MHKKIVSIILSSSKNLWALYMWQRFIFAGVFWDAVAYVRDRLYHWWFYNLIGETRYILIKSVGNMQSSMWYMLTCLVQTKLVVYKCLEWGIYGLKWFLLETPLLLKLSHRVEKEIKDHKHKRRTFHSNTEMRVWTLKKMKFLTTLKFLITIR